MMNQEDIFKKIGQILNELNDQYQYLSQNPQELNELELELFLANASFLSDHAQIVQKLNNRAIQKALPEHTSAEKEGADPLPVTPVESAAAETEDHHLHTEILPAIKPALEEDIFKIDNEPSTFEFILSDKPSSDKFDFEEKSIDEIFDRPLSKEEEQIIAQKQKLRELDSLGSDLPEDDEIGPEPFLVSIPEETVTEPEPEPEPKEEPVEEPEPAEEPQPEDEPVEEPAPEPIAGHQEAAKAQEELAAPVKEYTPVSTPVTQEELFKPVPAPVQEQPKAKPTLNDILSGNNNPKPFHTSTSRTVITDLKQAISLNDKMRYIKDLFNGYNLAYAEAIDLLNKMPDFKTADAFLQNNYAVKNNWAAKQDTADQFYELLNQRFPSK